MRVSCLQESLAKGLSIVGRVVSTRSTMPVLGNILLEAKDGELRLAATNFEIGINCWIGAKVEDEGAITIPARLLTDFVNNLPAEQIDMDLSVRTQTLNLRCARYDANMKGIDAADFPIMPTVGTEEAGDDATDNLGGTRIGLERDGLRKMIDQVVFAAATDESHPTFTGVEVTFADNNLKMAATDGYRLSIRSVTLGDADGDVSGATSDQAPAEPMTAVVPARSLGELSRISADADDGKPVQVIVTQSRNQILFQLWGKSGDRGGFHRVELVSELIDNRSNLGHFFHQRTGDMVCDIKSHLIEQL